MMRINIFVKRLTLSVILSAFMSVLPIAWGMNDGAEGGWSADSALGLKKKKDKDKKKEGDGRPPAALQISEQSTEGNEEETSVAGLSSGGVTPRKTPREERRYTLLHMEDFDYTVATTQAIMMANGQREVDSHILRQLEQFLRGCSQARNFSAVKPQGTDVLMAEWDMWPNLGLFIKDADGKNLIELASAKHGHESDEIRRRRLQTLNTLLGLQEILKPDRETNEGLRHLFRLEKIKDRMKGLMGEHITKGALGLGLAGKDYLKHRDFYHVAIEGRADVLLAYLYAVSSLGHDQLIALVNHKPKGADKTALEVVQGILKEDAAVREQLGDKESVDKLRNSQVGQILPEHVLKNYQHVERILKHVLDPSQPIEVFVITDQEDEEEEEVGDQPNLNTIDNGSDQRKPANNDNASDGKKHKSKKKKKDSDIQMVEVIDLSGDNAKSEEAHWEAIDIHSSWEEIAAKMERMARGEEGIPLEAADWLLQVGKRYIGKIGERDLPPLAQADMKAGLPIFLWRLNHNKDTMLSLMLPKTYKAGALKPHRKANREDIDQAWARLCGATKMLYFPRMALVQNIAHDVVGLIRELVEADSDEDRMQILIDFDTTQKKHGGIGQLMTNVLNWGFLLDNDGGPGKNDPDYDEKGDVLISRFLMQALRTPRSDEYDEMKAEWIAAAFRTAIQEGNQAAGDAGAAAALERVKKLLPPSWTRLKVKDVDADKDAQAPVIHHNSLSQLVFNKIEKDLPPGMAKQLEGALNIGAKVALDAAKKAGDEFVFNWLDKVVLTACPSYAWLVTPVQWLYRLITWSAAPPPEAAAALVERSRLGGNQKGLIIIDPKANENNDDGSGEESD